MKNIVLARVDDRLIHGEVVSVWTPSLNVNRIIVVDDEVAADKFNKRVIKALAPNGVKVTVNGTEKGAKRQAVCMNAGAALYIAGKAKTIEDGVKMAENLIDSGAAAAKLEEFIKLSNEI